MNTVARMKELADERELSLFQLAQLCEINYNTLKRAEERNSQLGIDFGRFDLVGNLASSLFGRGNRLLGLRAIEIFTTNGGIRKHVHLIGLHLDDAARDENLFDFLRLR